MMKKRNKQTEIETGFVERNFEPARAGASGRFRSEARGERGSSRLLLLLRIKLSYNAQTSFLFAFINHTSYGPEAYGTVISSSFGIGPVPKMKRSHGCRPRDQRTPEYRKQTRPFLTEFLQNRTTTAKDLDISPIPYPNLHRPLPLQLQIQLQ